MLTQTADQPSKIVYIKTSKGLFGPYPTRSLAEQMILSGQIPKEQNEMARIVERFSDGRELLLG